MTAPTDPQPKPLAEAREDREKNANDLRWLARGDNFDEGTKAVLRRAADLIEADGKRLDALDAAARRIADYLVGMPSDWMQVSIPRHLLRNLRAALSASPAPETDALHTGGEGKGETNTKPERGVNSGAASAALEGEGKSAPSRTEPLSSRSGTSPTPAPTGRDEARARSKAMSDWQTELAANLHNFIADLDSSVEHLPDAEAVELAQADAAMLRRVEAVLRSPPAVRVTPQMVEAACDEWCDRHMPFGNLAALRRSMEHALNAALAGSFPIQQDAEIKP